MGRGLIKDPSSVQGAGRDPERSQNLTTDLIDFLPGCTLKVTERALTPQDYHFMAELLPDARCCFNYRGQTYQVSLGFEASIEAFLSYDKGIDPETGKAIWGAKLWPFLLH